MKTAEPIKETLPCFECEGGTLLPVVEDYQTRLKGHGAITVPDVPKLRCDTCGETLLGDAGNRKIEAYLHKVTHSLSPQELQQFLDKYRLTQKEASRITGLGEKNISRWLTGRARASSSVSKFIRVLIARPDAFEVLKSQKFEESATDTAFLERQPDEAEKLILKQVDFPKLVEMGIFNRITSPKEKRSALCKFLEFSDLVQFGEAMEQACQTQVAFKDTGQQFSPVSGGLWVKIGEMAAHRMKVERYERSKLEDVVKQLREYTQDEPANVFEEVQQLLASAGVALVVVPIMKQSAYRGCTRLLSPTKAMIIHGLKFKNVAEFWKVLFHEIAHLLLHIKSPDDVFAEYEVRDDSSEEKQADEWAYEALIYSEKLLSFSIRHPTPTIWELISFAQDLKVHPAIAAEAFNRRAGKEVLSYAYLRQEKLFPTLKKADCENMWQLSRHLITG